MKLNTLIAAILLATASSAVQAHDYINQVAQARDSLVQAKKVFGSIACEMTQTDRHNNMATCVFASAVDNALMWIDEIKPSDSNEEAKRKINNALMAMGSHDDEFKEAWNSPRVKPRRRDFAIADTLSTNVMGYLGLLFIDPKVKERPVPTWESVTKRLEQDK